MTDMLVRLYALPALDAVIQRQHEKEIVIRRGLAAEKHVVLKWVIDHFSANWHSECDVAFAHVPISCFLATKNNVLVGFACYDVVRRGIFGPTGVHEAARGQGTGTALLIACLHDMWAQGYGYAAIGDVGPAEFYQKAVGATVIADSTPGVYFDMLREK